MTFPYCNEEDLSAGSPSSYSEKWPNPAVIDTNRNAAIVKPYANFVDEAFKRFRLDTDINSHIDFQKNNVECDELCMEASEDCFN